MLTTSETSKEETNEEEDDNEDKMDQDNDAEDNHEKDDIDEDEKIPFSKNEISDDNGNIATNDDSNSENEEDSNKSKTAKFQQRRTYMISDEHLPSTEFSDSNPSETNSPDGFISPQTTPTKVEKVPYSVSNTKRTPTKKRIYTNDKAKRHSTKKSSDIDTSSKRMRLDDSEVSYVSTNQTKQVNDNVSSSLSTKTSSLKDENNVSVENVQSNMTSASTSHITSDHNDKPQREEVSLIDAVIVSRVFDKTQSPPNTSKQMRNTLDAAVFTRLQNEETSKSTSTKVIDDIMDHKRPNTSVVPCIMDKKHNTVEVSSHNIEPIKDIHKEDEEEDEHSVIDIDIEGDSECTPNASDMLREKMKPTQQQKRIINSNIDIDQTSNIQSFESIEVNPSEYFEEIVEIDNDTPAPCTHVEISEVSVEIDEVVEQQNIVEQEVIIQQQRDALKTEKSDSTTNEANDQKETIKLIPKDQIKLEKIVTRDNNAIQNNYRNKRLKVASNTQLQSNTYESLNTNIVGNNRDDSYTSSIEVLLLAKVVNLF